jgi:hypothetical protein
MAGQRREVTGHADLLPTVTRRVLTVLLTAGLAVSWSCKGEAPTRDVAERAARVAVEEFAVREAIPIDAIGVPVTRFQDPPGVWRISYTTSTDPQYSIDVIINRSGRAEIEYKKGGGDS